MEFLLLLVVSKLPFMQGAPCCGGSLLRSPRTALFHAGKDDDDDAAMESFGAWYAFVRHRALPERVERLPEDKKLARVLNQCGKH